LAAEKFSFASTGINYILKWKTIILNCNNINIRAILLFLLRVCLINAVLLCKRRDIKKPDWLQT